MWNVLYPALGRRREEDRTCLCPDVMAGEMTQVTVTVRATQQLGKMLKCFDMCCLWGARKENLTQLLTRHLGMWTEVQERETEGCPCLAGRGGGSREEEGERDLESAAAFVKMIIWSRRHGYGRVRGKGGKRSMDILGAEEQGRETKQQKEQRREEQGRLRI